MVSSDTTRERRVANAHTIQNHATFIRPVGERLRGDYAQPEYGMVTLPSRFSGGTSSGC
jgi:hypothetical protein